MNISASKLAAGALSRAQQAAESQSARSAMRDAIKQA